VDQLTLPLILDHPVSIEVFKDFMIRQHTEETLTCWLLLRRYRSLTAAAVRQSLAVSIYAQFMAEGAPQQVNLSHSLRDKLGRAVSGGDARKELFDEASSELYTLMKSNSWASFVGP
jgi:hypothetical protein